ncbi:hypothetical protein TNCV_1518841 [Trichonephila clavipes]|nr:hypothetical protein TNCV_1518841 [Trichonephila clavipes]
MIEAGCIDDNRVSVWRSRDERLNPAFALLRHTAPTAGVMVTTSIDPWHHDNKVAQIDNGADILNCLLHFCCERFVTPCNGALSRLPLKPYREIFGARMACLSNQIKKRTRLCTLEMFIYWSFSIHLEFKVEALEGKSSMSAKGKF